MDDQDGFAGDHLNTDGVLFAAADAAGADGAAGDVGRGDGGRSNATQSLAARDRAQTSGAKVLRPPQWSAGAASNQASSKSAASASNAKTAKAAAPSAANAPAGEARGRRANSRRGVVRRSTTAFGRDVIIGSSPAAAALREKIDLYARADAPVLISGETGVGKELVAKRLHAHGDRADQRFLPVNLSAMPDTMVASALFGHEKGAYTGAHTDRDGAFAAADGGTLLLDEIGDLPLPLQTHLLRCLEDQVIMRLGGFAARQVNVRLIAATNVDLAAAVAAGRFREDLYYRMNVLPIWVAPLRERGDDVVEIAEALIQQHDQARYRAVRLTPQAADRLKSHAYPGNVRELRSVMAQALVLACDGRGDDAVLPEDIRFFAPARATEAPRRAAPLDAGEPACAPEPAVEPDAAVLSDADLDDMNVRDANALITRWLTMRALRVADGNVSRAAALSGRSRSTIHAFVNALEGVDFAQEYAALRAEVRALLQRC